MHSPSIPEGMMLAPGVQMFMLMPLLQSHEVQCWEPQSSLQAAKRMQVEADNTQKGHATANICFAKLDHILFAEWVLFMGLVFCLKVFLVGMMEEYNQNISVKQQLEKKVQR